MAGQGRMRVWGVSFIKLARIGLLCVVSCGMLSGCVEEPSRSHKVPVGTDGGVLLKITDNLRTFLHWGDSFTVRRMPDAASADETCYSLRFGTRGEIAGVYLGGALPPGTYQFPRIGADQESVGPCNGRDWLKTNSSGFAKFTVLAGKLTYLGVLARTGGEELHVSYLIPLKPDSQVDVGEIARAEFPDLAALDREGPQGWVAATLPYDRQAVERYALAHAYGLIDPNETSNGTWIFGTRVGMVRTWAPGQSKPVLHDTGRRVAFEATAVLPDGSWLVGGEESTLLRSADAGHTWQSVRGDLPFGLVEHIQPLGQDVFLTLVDGKDVFIYRGRVDAARWQKIASFHAEFAIWTGMRGVEPQSFLVNNKYYITTLPSKRLGVVDVTTGVTDVRDLPGGLASFNVSRDGVLRCRCTATIALNPYESHDLGKTWQSSTFSRYMELPGMADATHGVTLYRSGAFADPGLAYTEDGQHWNQVADAPFTLRLFFFSRDGKTAYASDGAGVIRVSRDGGKQWWTVVSIPLPIGESVPYVRF